MRTIEIVVLIERLLRTSLMLIRCLHRWRGGTSLLLLLLLLALLLLLSFLPLLLIFLFQCSRHGHDLCLEASGGRRH